MTNTSVPYEYIRSKLKDCNPVNISNKSGACYDGEKQELYVKLMGKRYIVQYPSGYVYHEDYSEVDQFVMKTLILRYLINAKGMPATGKEINYKDVPGGQVYYRNFHGRCIMRLARTFGGNIPAFEEAMEKLNGTKNGYGDISYRFQFLNNIYITFILWKGDDEFPPSANILFDENVPYYFDAEDLAVVGDISIGCLRKLISPIVDKL
ncbi:MAG: DUF3786 domain-containing protein [Peptococcaceae bacterium]|nr:DUF3786 domain-containing protein [Peptococcaceae bacterium]